MNRPTLTVVLLLALSPSAWADDYPKNPKIDVLHYAFRIRLSDRTDAIEAQAEVVVRYLADSVGVLRLDLVRASGVLGGRGMTVTAVESEGQGLAFVHEGEELRITLPTPTRRNQRSSYLITYSGVPASGLKIAPNKYGDRTFFSDNWPNRGRHWLPMVDHPYDKATCEFIVTAPAHYQVVSNGLKIEETDLPDGTRLTHWRQSVPIASWLYVLGVARFAVQYVDRFDHKSIETWVYYQDRDAGFHDFAVPTRQVLEFYTNYVGPFAYEKLANIQSNSVSGGMEAASAIFYSENAVVGDRNERWRNVVIHEIAHQWFGNAVTEYDWDDVWLSEGFATYFTLLFIEHAYGQDAFQAGLAESRKVVMAFHERNPQYRIVHDNLRDMEQVTSSHTYQKGAWVLHMLRGVVGTENFWKGIRSYYRKYLNGNATTADFRREMEEASGVNLEPFFEQWLYRPGALRLSGAWRYSPAKREVAISLDQVPDDGSLFTMPVEVAIYPAEGKPVLRRLEVERRQHQFAIPVDFAPARVVLDPNNWVLMDARLIKK